MRPVSIIRNFTKHAKGSVLVSFGDTKVLCTASIKERVPFFLRKSKRGWVTAEYSMLPWSTNTCTPREARGADNPDACRPALLKKRLNTF